MIRKLALAAVCVAAVSGYATAQDARTVIADAQRALGNPQSVTYSGSARDVAFQQCGSNAAALICYGTHDPMRPITNYVRVIDLNAPLSRHTGVTMNIPPVAATRCAPGAFFQQVTAQQADIAQPWAQSLEFYITPWGFLKGAAANNATAARRNVAGETFTVLSWSPTVKAPSGKAYTVNGYVNSDNLVERVETWLGENIMGDMHIVANYSDWRDFGGGVQVPTQIEQTRGGWPFFEVEVAAARANPANLATLAVDTRPPPAAGGGGGGGPPGGQPPALVVTTERLGDGVFRYTTGAGSYDSIIIEFNNYIMMLEAGQSQVRAPAYVAEIKKQFPNKPIRYVMVTHPHADHTGGLPVLVAEGATLVVQENSREFFERALNTPRTLLDGRAREEGAEARPRRVRDRQKGLYGWHAHGRAVSHLSRRRTRTR